VLWATIPLTRCDKFRETDPCSCNSCKKEHPINNTDLEKRLLIHIFKKEVKIIIPTGFFLAYSEVVVVPDRGLTGAHVPCLQLAQESVLLAVYFRSSNYMN